jgi:hypothetical protein
VKEREYKNWTKDKKTKKGPKKGTDLFSKK